MFTKTLDKHRNLRIRAMIERLMVYNFVFHHVAGEDNTIVDCFSRLTREIKEAQHYSLCYTLKLGDRSADQSKAGIKNGSSVKAIRNSNKPTEDDPWVEFLGEVAMTDSDYITMVHHLEAGTEIKNIDKECELSKCHNYKDQLSVIKEGKT